MVDHGKGPEFLDPMVAHQDRFISHVVRFNCVSLPQSMLNQLLHNVLVERVCHVEHVLSVASSALGILGWEVIGHRGELDELVVKGLHRELVVLDHRDELNLPQLQQLLLAPEHILGEILGEHLVGRHIVLKGVSMWMMSVLTCRLFFIWSYRSLFEDMLSKMLTADAA